MLTPKLIIKINLLIVIMTLTLLGTIIIINALQAVEAPWVSQTNITNIQKEFKKPISRVNLLSISQAECQLSQCLISCTGGSVEQLALAINALFNQESSKCTSNLYSLTLTSTSFTNKTIQSGWLKALQVPIQSIKLASTTIDSFGRSIFSGAPFDSSKSLSVVFSNADVKDFSSQMFTETSIQLFEVDFNSMSDGILIEENLFGSNPSALYAITLKYCLVNTAALKNLTSKGNMLSGLIALDVSYNLLLTLESGIFSKAPKLQQLFLMSSGINFIEIGAFNGLSQLIMLHLTDNNLKTLPDGVFNDLSALISFFIDGNPWSCKCDMQWFKDFLGKLPPLDHKRCRTGSGWVNMDDVEFCPDNLTTTVVTTTSTVVTTTSTTEAATTTTSPTSTNDFIFEKILCRNLLMYNAEIDESITWFESTFKRRDIKYTFSEITDPANFIVSLNAKLTANDFFIWTNVKNRSNYGCVFNISSIIVMDLQYGETYTLCLSSNDTTDTYALIANDCSALTTPLDWSHRPWLINGQKTLIIATTAITTLACIAVSSAVVYMLVRYHPELLKGNKRVLIVKRGSYSPKVLVMPTEKKLRHVSLCTDNEGYLAPKLKNQWMKPDKRYVELDDFADGSVFLENEEVGVDGGIYEPPPLPPNQPIKRRDSGKPYFYSNM